MKNKEISLSINGESFIANISYYRRINGDGTKDISALLTIPRKVVDKLELKDNEEIKDLRFL